MTKIEVERNRTVYNREERERVIWVAGVRNVTVFDRMVRADPAYYLYATIECANKFIILSRNTTDPSAEFAISTLSRDSLGIIIVVIDGAILIVFLLFIWIVQYLIKADTLQNNNKLFETHNFTVVFKEFPQLTEEYPLEKLKADLWAHIIKIIEEEPQQIQKLDDEDE